MGRQRGKVCPDYLALGSRWRACLFQCDRESSGKASAPWSSGSWDLRELEASLTTVCRRCLWTGRMDTKGF